MTWFDFICNSCSSVLGAPFSAAAAIFNAFWSYSPVKIKKKFSFIFKIQDIDQNSLILYGTLNIITIATLANPLWEGWLNFNTVASKRGLTYKPLLSVIDKKKDDLISPSIVFVHTLSSLFNPLKITSDVSLTVSRHSNNVRHRAWLVSQSKCFL